jgi:ribose transport system permease protein
VNGTPEFGPAENVPSPDAAPAEQPANDKPDMDPALAGPGTGDGRRLADWLSLVGPYLGLLLVVALFSFLTWQQDQLETFLNLGNLKLITVHASVTATVALGMTLIMISGGIDLSVGYVVSLVTVMTVLAYRFCVGIELSWLRWVVPQSWLTWVAGTASLWAIAAGILTGGLAGLGNGVLITRLKVVPFVVTLGMMGVARGLAQFLSGGVTVRFPDPVPGWVRWVSRIQPNPDWLVFGPAVWSVAILAVAAGILLRYTVLGRYCYALGSNEATARLCGIRVERTKILLYTLAGLLTGWAGILQTARSGSGSYNVMAGLELEVIAAVVIGGGSLTGGVGTVTGTLVGALMLAVLENGCGKLDYLSNDFRFIIIGAIIVVVAALNSWRLRRLR